MARPPTIQKPSASLTANEALVDLYMERAIDLLRLEAGTRDKVVGLLVRLESEIASSIAKIDPSGTDRVRYQRDRLAKLQKEVRESIRATYREIDARMAREIREVVDVEAAWTGRAVNAAVRVEFVDAGVSRSQLKTLVSNVLIQGASSRDWWSRQAGGLSERFADEMRRGVAIGETNAQLIARIRGTDDQRGLMDISRSSAERLVRASVQAAANAGRNAMYEENAELISALQWSATLDTRTSVWCLARDGLHYHPETHEPIGHDVPWLEGPGVLHWGCRSTSIPILKSWRELGIDADEIPETTRASMDGQVAAETTFESWLEKQSEDRQDKVLGEGKASLWRDGKISFRDLLDQNGRPLTTEQLREKASRAP